MKVLTIQQFEKQKSYFQPIDIYNIYIYIYIQPIDIYIYIYFLVSQIETTISFSHETLKYLPETGLQRTKKKKKEKPTYAYICLCVIRVCICVCV